MRNLNDEFKIPAGGSPYAMPEYIVNVHCVHADLERGSPSDRAIHRTLIKLGNNRWTCIPYYVHLNHDFVRFMHLLKPSRFYGVRLITCIHSFVQERIHQTTDLFGISHSCVFSGNVRHFTDSAEKMRSMDFYLLTNFINRTFPREKPSSSWLAHNLTFVWESDGRRICVN